MTIKFFHLNDVSMSLLPMVLIAFLVCCFFPFCLQGGAAPLHFWLLVPIVTILFALRVLCWTDGISRCMVFGAISTMVVWGSFLLVLSFLITFANCIERFASFNTHLLHSMINSIKTLSYGEQFIGAAKSLHLSSISSSLMALMKYHCILKSIALADPSPLCACNAIWWILATSSYGVIYASCKWLWGHILIPNV